MFNSTLRIGENILTTENTEVNRDFRKNVLAKTLRCKLKLKAFFASLRLCVKYIISIIKKGAPSPFSLHFMLVRLLIYNYFKGSNFTIRSSHTEAVITIADTGNIHLQCFTGNIGTNGLN